MFLHRVIDPTLNPGFGVNAGMKERLEVRDRKQSVEVENRGEICGMCGGRSGT